MTPSTSAHFLESIETEWLGIVSVHPRRLIQRRGQGGGAPGQTAGKDYCPRCGGSVGPGEFNAKTGCVACRGRRYPWAAMHRLGPYRDDLRHWIHAVKFQRWDAMGVELGRLLARSIIRSGVNADAVVPVPTTLRRRFRRGIDHSGVIAWGVSRETRWPILRPLRREARPPQRAVPDSRRRDNIRRAFRLRRWHSVEGLRLLLVDDITTSRSTLVEATRTLLRAGADEVTTAVLAATESPQRPGRPTGNS